MNKYEELIETIKRQQLKAEEDKILRRAATILLNRAQTADIRMSPRVNLYAKLTVEFYQK